MNRVILMPILVGAVAVPLALTGLTHESRESEAVAAPARRVDTVRPAAAQGTTGLTLSGRVKAAQEVTVTAQVPARLTSLVREGETFRAGQPLAVFDSPETRQAVESAGAALASATANREQARRQSARFDSLLARGLVAERQVEVAAAEREAAEAGWTNARATLSQWIDNTRLSVPFDGIVVRRHVDTGSLLSPGQPVLDVRSNAVGEIEVAVPESEADHLASGRPLVQVASSEWMEAEVIRVDGMIDYRTRTRTAHLKLADLAGIEPGAYARVRLDGVAEAGRLTVPVTSLVSRGSLTGVFVVRDGHAWLRWLRAGRTEGDRIEILAGLSPEDVIVADPSNLLDGQPVAVAR